MSVFHAAAVRAVDALFAKFGQTSQLTFHDSTTLETLVIHRFPDKVVDFLDGRVQSETDMFEIRIADVPTTKTIQSITKNGVTYTVQGVPQRDQHGLIYKVDVYAP